MTFTGAGQRIMYSYEVRNITNIPVTRISVVDGRLGVVCTIPVLKAGDFAACPRQFTRITTATDVRVGSVVDTATAQGFVVIGGRTVPTLVVTSNTVTVRRASAIGVPVTG